MPDLQPNLFALVPDELPALQRAPDPAQAICCHCDCEHDPDDSLITNGEIFCPDCFACPHCGDHCSRDDGADHNGETYCSDCVHSCERCGETTLDSDTLTAAYDRRRNQEIRCEDCRWRCVCCGEYYTNDVENNSLDNGDTICERCYLDNYFYCEDCGSTCHLDDYAQDGHCQSCWESEEDSIPSSRCVVQNYSYKPTATFYGTGGRIMPGSLYLGMEIEVDYKTSEYLDNEIHAKKLPVQWYAKNDGSLTSGFECVSHPGTWEFWRDDPFAWTKELVKAGYRSYDVDTCGMHIHVSKDWLSQAEQLKLLLFFQTNVATVIRLSRRKGDAWQGYARVDTSSDLRQLVRKVKMHDEGTESEFERYEAINLLPTHTLEFRIFRGTLNVRSIKRNLALVVALCHYVKASKRNQLSFGEFIAWLLNNGSRVLGNDAMATDLYLWVVNAAGGDLPGDDRE